MTKVKPFVLRFISKQKKLIIFAINLVLVLSFLSYFLSFNRVQAVWLGMSRENIIDNLSDNSGDSTQVQLQLDSQSKPYIVWSDDTAGNGDIFLKKWTVGAGSGICGVGINDCWTKMNGTAGYDNLSDNSSISKEPKLRLDSANSPYIVWSDYNVDNYDIYFTKWTAGTGWTQMDGVTLGYENLSDNSDDSDSVIIEFNSSNIPYIVWSDATTGSYDIYFTKWTAGTGWTQMDGTTLGYDNLSNSISSSANPKMKIDANNNPLIIWDDSTTGNGDIYFTKWTPGTGWTKMDETVGKDNLSGNAGDSIFSNMDIDTANNPYAVWADRTSGNQEIYFKKWTPGIGWTKMDDTLGFDNLSNNAENSIMPQIVLDTTNKPYVSWTDETTGGRDIYFKKWNSVSSSWTKMDGTAGVDNLSNNVGYSEIQEMKLDSANNPYLAWPDETLGNFEIYLTKWTPAVGWTKMDGATLGYENISDNSGESTVDFQIELNNVNFPYLVWLDDTEGNKEIYFTRWLLQEKGLINISANIDPTLTLDLSSTTCNLGTFDATKANTCQYDATVTTNASSGYTAYIRDDGNLRNATNDINDVAGGTTTVGSEEYGVATSDTDVVDITAKESGADCTTANGGASDVSALALTTSDQSFAVEDAPVDSDVVTLCHSASITNTTPAGAYAQQVTITVVGNF